MPAEKDLDRHLAFLARKDRLIKTGGTDLVFVGDSITDWWRNDPQREIFEDYFGRFRPYNIGIAGDETQHVLWRIDHGELDGLTPKLVVLMIGTNNLANANRMSAAETADGVAAVVGAIRRKLPAAKILLLGIFPRGNRSDDPLRLAVNATNTIIAGLADRKTAFYLDVGPKFLAADGTLPGDLMPDYLHPNARGYQIWAERDEGRGRSVDPRPLTLESGCRRPVSGRGDPAISRAEKIRIFAGTKTYQREFVAPHKMPDISGVCGGMSLNVTVWISAVSEWPEKRDWHGTCFRCGCLQRGLLSQRASEDCDRGAKKLCWLKK